MAHKTLIGGTAHEITGGKSLINGTAYDITGGRTLIYGTGRGISFGRQPTLNDFSWAEISEIAASGQAANYWAVGDCKEIVLNGTVGTVEFSNYRTYVYIIGFDHNGAINTIDFGTFKSALSGGVDICLADSEYGYSPYDGTKYFNMNHAASSNAGGWKNCNLRYDVLGSTDVNGGDATSFATTSPVLGTLMAALPLELRAVMKPMTIYTDNAGGGIDEPSCVTASVDYLPLLAEFEVFGARSYANSAEEHHQKQYEYYFSGNPKKKYRHNATRYTDAFAADLWTRSPFYDSEKAFCTIKKEETPGGVTAAMSKGLAPIFRV